MFAYLFLRKRRVYSECLYHFDSYFQGLCWTRFKINQTLLLLRKKSSFLPVREQMPPYTYINVLFHSICLTWTTASKWQFFLHFKMLKLHLEDPPTDEQWTRKACQLHDCLRKFRHISELSTDGVSMALLAQLMCLPLLKHSKIKNMPALLNISRVLTYHQLPRPVFLPPQIYSFLPIHQSN